MRIPRGVLLALPMIAFLPGCPIYTGGGGHTTDPECARDRDCPSGEVCNIDGLCVPTAECTLTAECDAGEVCAAGTCVPGPTMCRLDGDCTVGSWCDDGTCTPSGACTADTECATGFWCDFRGTCVPRDPDACRAHADCTGTELCIEGYCRARDAACELDRDCAPGNLCVNSECTEPCTADDTCSAGDTCQDNFCRPASECDTSSSCARGEHCVDERCLPDCLPPGTTCTAGSYCAPEDQLCRPDWEPEPFCAEDSDCMAGRTCLDGVCRTPCDTMTDAECLTFDAQLPLCRPEAGAYYCFAEREESPECRVQADCTDGRDCVDGLCRNRG